MFLEPLEPERGCHHLCQGEFDRVPVSLHHFFQLQALRGDVWLEAKSTSASRLQGMLGKPVLGFYLMEATFPTYRRDSGWPQTWLSTTELILAVYVKKQVRTQTKEAGRRHGGEKMYLNVFER